MSHADYLAPPGLRVRGTVIVVPGRGETRATYARLGSRLAYDAYRVCVMDPPAVDPADVATFLCELGQRLSRVVTEVADEIPDGLVRPLALVGSDLGAAGISALVARGDRSTVWWPQALVLAALPGYAVPEQGSWDEELDLRTRCPVHRSVLTTDASVRRGALADPVPSELLDAVYGSTAVTPQLLLAGDADSMADRSALARAAKTLPTARLVVVRGAHHDVLNDLQHRSVAAEIVAFLEAVRDNLSPAIVVEASAW